MPQLALNHVQRDAFTGHLDGMSVAQLVRREPPPPACSAREPLKLRPSLDQTMGVRGSRRS